MVLNACYSKVQAETLVTHIPCVIGMPSAIGDKSAIVYAAELYRALAFGKSVANAHQCALAALALHSMAGVTRDVDVAEAVLRTSPPELLARIGVDAGRVHIVQGALPACPVPASAGESRIHLEIDIDSDLESLDASTLAKLVSEICQLRGARSVRILCVTKGSVRISLSFEPDAARALLSLRHSGRLNQIGGLRVSNVVDLGEVEIWPAALPNDVTEGTSMEASISLAGAELRARRRVHAWTIGAVAAAWVPGSMLALPAIDVGLCRDVAACFGVEHWSAESVSAEIGASLAGEVGTWAALSFIPVLRWAVAGKITKAVGEAIIAYFKARSPYA